MNIIRFTLVARVSAPKWLLSLQETEYLRSSSSWQYHCCSNCSDFRILCSFFDFSCPFIA